jgi:hypothetical protein
MADTFGFENRVVIVGTVERFEKRSTGNGMVWLRTAEAEDKRIGKPDDANPRFITRTLAVFLGASILDSAAMLEGAPIEQIFAKGATVEVIGRIRGIEAFFGDQTMVGNEIAATFVRRVHGNVRPYTRFALVGFIKSAQLKSYAGGPIVIQTGKRPPKPVSGTNGTRSYVDLARIRVTKKVADALRDQGKNLKEALHESAHVAVFGPILGIRQDAVREDGRQQSYYGQEFLAAAINRRKDVHAVIIPEEVEAAAHDASGDDLADA